MKSRKTQKHINEIKKTMQEEKEELNKDIENLKNKK
jgi:hypothetical protein